MRMFNQFETYEKARDYYQTLRRDFGCVAMEWGFGRWLWMEVVENEPTLDYWQRLHDLHILTNAGAERLARAQKRAAQESGVE